MKKQTKTTVKRLLDKEVSRIVRARGECAWCHSKVYEKFQAAHIFSRSNMAVRFDMDNLLCLCAGCHFKAHKNPILFTEFVAEYLGDAKYEALITRAAAIKKWTLEEMQSYLAMLRRVK